MAICEKPEPEEVERSTLYEVAPVTAFQVRLICVVEAGLAARPATCAGVADGFILKISSLAWSV